jgi:small subunit ribosomal protein S17
MERSTRRVLQGRVVSTKMEKTIVVVVETFKKHPLYKKNVLSSMKIKAHDETSQANVGDVVKIMETRPLSATKRFRLVEVMERGEE